MKDDWKRAVMQRLFTGAMAMYKEGIPREQGLPESVSAEELVGRMTLEEKLSMLTGQHDLAVRGVPRLGIPAVWASDATSGVRCFGRATSFPSGVMLAATWDREQLYRVGSVLADECRAQGVSILLGPGVNIARVPVNGRNFEYFGEDPFLAGDLAVSYIRGVQSGGVIPVIKHLACNNSEYDRHKSNSVVDERTLHELYLPAFEHGVVRGEVQGVMTSYNLVNGTYASEHPGLLREILKEQWGFKGIVLSDWNSLYSTDGVIREGVDVEMPKAKWLTRGKMRRALKRRRITEEMIDRKILNITATFLSTGVYKHPEPEERPLDTEENHNISLETALGAVVLLKHEHQVLPLDVCSQVLLTGRSALETPSGGGGSSYMPLGPESLNLLEGMNREGLRVAYSRHPADSDLRKSDHVVIATGFDRWLESEAYDRPYRLPEGEEDLILRAAQHCSSVIVLLHAGGDVDTSLWADNVQGILFCGYLGMHRGTAPAMLLSGKANPSGKLPFTMARSLEDYPAMRHYYRKPWEIRFMRILGPQGNTWFRPVHNLEYQERLMVGYRGFDSLDRDVQFPFGHGLSYTDFSLQDVILSRERIPWDAVITSGSRLDGDPIVTVSCTVENTGDRPGAQVIQLYIHEPHPPLQRPEQELKGFEKVYLNPGEQQSVRFQLNSRSFMCYDPDRRDWRVDPGRFDLRVAFSSRDIRGEAEVVLLKPGK